MSTYIKKDFMSGPLLHPTTVFVDAPNMIYYADARVITRLIDIMMTDGEDGLYHRMFDRIFDILHSYSDSPIELILQRVKQSRNILYDIVTWKVVTELDMEKTPYQYLDELYNTLLFDIDISTGFIPTTIGSALKVIVDHRNLMKMYIYLPTMNIDSSFKELSEFFQVKVGDKVELISGGPIGTAIVSVNADEYFLNDVEDVRHVAAIETTATKRIYLPAFAYNFQRDLDTMSVGRYAKNIEENIYQSTNIDINLIQIPY